MGATTSTTATPTIILGTAAPKNYNMSIVDLNAQTANPVNMMIVNQLMFQLRLSGIENASKSTLPTQLTLLLVNWIKAIPSISKYQYFNQHYDLYMQLHMAIVIVETDLKISLDHSAILSSVCGQSFASSPLIVFQLNYAFAYLEQHPFVYNGDQQYNTVRTGMIAFIPDALPAPEISKESSFTPVYSPPAPVYSSPAPTEGVQTFKGAK